MGTLSRFAALCILSTASATAVAAEHLDHALEVQDILQNNHAAVRLASAPDTLENMDIVLQIAEAQYTLIARYRATSDGHMRIDLFDDQTRVYSEGKDDDGAWEWPAGKEAPENVYHDGARALEHGIEFNLFSLAELADRGHQIELAGKEHLRDNDYFVLKITLSDGFETYRYVNGATWLVDLSRDFRAFHPGMDNTRKSLETRYDQWRIADGVVSAGRSRNIDLEAGVIIATTLVLKSRYNGARERLNLPRSYVPANAPEWLAREK